MISFETFTCKDSIPYVNLGGCFKESQTFAPYGYKNVQKIILHYLMMTYPFVNGLEDDYYNFEYWLKHKVYWGLLSGSRQLVFVRQKDKLAGMAILKRDSYEKKICTLVVSKNYRGSNIGTLLLDHCITALGTSDIGITVTDRRTDTLGSLLKKKGFNPIGVLENYYKRNAVEQFFYYAQPAY